MKISVIIPTKDRAAILQRTIDNLIPATDGMNAEIIIVNDSRQGVRLDHTHPGLTIIDNPGAGAASARNTGLKQATGDLLLFLDDDIIVNKGNILRMLTLHQEHQHAAFIFFWLYPPDLIEVLPRTGFGRYILKHQLFSNSHRIKIEGKEGNLIRTNGLTSQYFSIHRTDFLKTGGYDERIPHAGIEDYLLYKILKKNGIDVFLSPSDVVFQNESDRISLLSVMERYKRGAATIRMAKEIGHTEMEVVFHPLKKIIYPLLWYARKGIYQVAMSLQNIRALSFIYFKLVNLLLGLSQYEGYYIQKPNNHTGE